MSQWPLNTSHFTWSDRIKLASFFLNPKKRWTMDAEVRGYEQEMAKYVGVKYAVFVSSGSTANTILAMWLKETDKRKKVIFPSTTWITSVSPFIREGFEPVFVDVNLEDLSIDLKKTEEILKKDKDIACIFPTSLLGFTPDLFKLWDLGNDYCTNVMMDNCENTFGTYGDVINPEINVSALFTSTTSTYFGHQLQSIEGGFIFTNSQKEYEYFLMARNHGMVRSLPKEKQIHYSNGSVNPLFDFRYLGNNFRNSDIHALAGRLDLKRIHAYIKARKMLYNVFRTELDPKKYILPKEFDNRQHVAFSLPVIAKDKINPRAQVECERLGIETRPIISGNLLRQTCFKKYGNPENFPNSEHLHKNGFYVGLHPKIHWKQVSNLVSHLNKL